MITQRALGVLKLRSEPRPSEGEAKNAGLQLPSVTLGLCSYQCLILLEMLHCVHIVCAGCVTGRVTFRELMLVISKKGFAASFAPCLALTQSCQGFTNDCINESMAGPLFFITHQ